MKTNRVPRLILSCLLVVGLTFGPVPRARADMFGGDLTLLSAILAEEINGVANLANIVQIATTISDGVGEAVGVIQAMYEVMEYLQNPSLILDAVKQGVYTALPELEGLETSLSDVISHGRAVAEGPEAFFASNGRASARGKRMFKQMHDYAFKSALWTRVFPDLEKKLKKKEMSPAEERALARIAGAGYQLKMTAENSALAALNDELEGLKAHAAHKQRADLQAAAVNAQASAITADATQRMARLKEVEFQEESSRKAHDHEVSDSFVEFVRENAPDLFRGKR